MRDAGMLDGDWVAVHKTREVRDGQIVVARIGDDVTVKTYAQRRNTVECCPPIRISSRSSIAAAMPRNS
jgi:repressor LexA